MTPFAPSLSKLPIVRFGRLIMFTQFKVEEQFNRMARLIAEEAAREELKGSYCTANSVSSQCCSVTLDDAAEHNLYFFNSLQDCATDAGFSTDILPYLKM